LDAKILSNSAKAATDYAQFLDKDSMLPQCVPYPDYRILKAAFFGCCLAISASSYAVDVEISVSDKVSATADFRPGEAGKPTILVLHGFLQTREFGIVKSLADTLADAGYTVLSPTLSLGISYRKNSLNCEALHLQGMDEDIEEIQQWMQWLHTRGYAKVVGIGHSFGATQLLAWRERYQDKDFNLIGISMVSSSPLSLSSDQKTKIQNQTDNELMHAPLSFCDIYTAPERKYTSYYKWNEKKILAALTASGSRTDIILGSEDKYLPPKWENQLAKAGARIHLIKGANHFMDGTEEFDMLDTTLSILNQ
jgi:dienelactone hydrolase